MDRVSPAISLYGRLGYVGPALDEQQVVAHQVRHPAGFAVEAELGHARRTFDEHVAVAVAVFFVLG